MELSTDQNKYRPGALVHVRQRDWVVLPSPNENLLLKPLDGADDETTGIYLPLAFEEDAVKSAEFPAPIKWFRLLWPFPNVTKLSLHSEFEVIINPKHEARNSKQIQNSKAQNSKQKQFSPEYREVTNGGFCFGHLFF